MTDLHQAVPVYRVVGNRGAFNLVVSISTFQASDNGGVEVAMPAVQEALERARVSSGADTLMARSIHRMAAPQLLEHVLAAAERAFAHGSSVVWLRFDDEQHARAGLATLQGMHDVSVNHTSQQEKSP